MGWQGQAPGLSLPSSRRGRKKTHRGLIAPPPPAQVPEQAGSSACENQPHPEFPSELEWPEEQGRAEGTSWERTVDKGWRLESSGHI